MSKDTKQKPALFALRAAVAFILLGILLGVLYWWAIHSYPSVAQWAEPGDHAAFVYNGETYYRSGVIGKRGLTLKKYPIDEIIGKVEDDGEPLTTVPETTAAPADTEEPEDLEDYEDYDTEEIETLPESVVPPVGAGLFSDKAHAYILYSVKDMTDYLLLLEEDGEYYLYYREGAQDPLAPDSDDE